MGIDASIYGGIKPIQIENPLTQYAQFSQLQQAQSQNRLADLMFGEKERAIADDKAMNQLYAGAVGADGKIDRSKLFSGLAQGGFGSKLPGIQESFAKGDKARVEMDEKTLKLAADRYKMYQGALGALSQEPNLTKDMVVQAGQALVQQGILPAELFDKSVASLPDDPVQLRARIAQGLKSQLTPEQMFTIFAPKPEKIDSGQQISFKDTNPNSPTFGQMVGGAPTQKVQTPDSVASNATSSENNKRAVGASYANASATRAVAASNVEAAKIKGNRDTEMKLADDFNAQSKGFKEVSDAYRTINATLDKATTSAAATLAGATKFMKLLDPGSVVRESELGMALAATGVFDRATNYFNTLQRGKVLTKSQAADFKNITNQIYKAAQEGQKSIDASYKQRAKEYGLRPEMIVQDLGQNQPGAAAPSSLPSGWTVEEK
jgi:hypothetical protein